MTMKLERWDDDEFIIVVNGMPTGPTVTKQSGATILSWLENSVKELEVNILRNETVLC